MMSATGNVAAGSAIAIMQSIGAAGLGSFALPVLGVGATVGGIGYGAVSGYNYFKAKKQK